MRYIIFENWPYNPMIMSRGKMNEMEKWTLTEMLRQFPDASREVIAGKMGIPIGRLDYLKRKHRVLPRRC